MRHITKLIGFMITCCITAIAAAQVGTGIFDGTIRIPREAVFGDAAVGWRRHDRNPSGA